MACCGSAGGGSRLARTMLSLAMLSWSAPLALLLWPFSFLPGISMPRRFCLSISRNFAAGLREALGRPLLGGQLRCTLSGRLLPFSPGLAGAVYSRFNILMLLLVALLVFAAALLFARGLVA